MKFSHTVDLMQKDDCSLFWEGETMCQTEYAIIILRTLLFIHKNIFIYNQITFGNLSSENEVWTDEICSETTVNFIWIIVFNLRVIILPKWIIPYVYFVLGLIEIIKLTFNMHKAQTGIMKIIQYHSKMTSGAIILMASVYRNVYT